MKEVHIDELPGEIRNYFINMEIEIVIEIIEKSGLILEFNNFLQSEQSFNSLDELCTEFAKKYPEKFHIVSEKDRYNKILLCSPIEIGALSI